ncbi:MAG: sensor histidine kinase [Candidatus Heteroscillospira sp.]|jgi:two-component system sensor histidine kinase CiaH
MTKTLQKRFVFTAMIAISVLLLFLVSAINIANYVFVNREVDEVLSQLVESEGLYTPPSIPPKKTPHQFPGAPTPDDIMGARYFFVRFDASGAIIHTNVNNILSVSEEEAAQMAQEVYGQTSQAGTVDIFKYCVTQALDEQSSLVIFLDISAQQRSILVVLLTSFLIGFLCWCVMLLLVIQLSRRAIEPIARSIDKQKQFVTNAGHEIKTPLAIILANTDAMELHNGENKWSRNIRAQSVRLNGLMQNLLTLAKMDEGIGNFPMSDFSAGLLLEEALDPYYETAEARQLKLQTEIDRDLALRANRDNIMQLISILLDNAVKYTPDGGEIIVSLKHDKGVVLRLENTCITPPEDDLERLFDRFYRGDTARTQRSGGYGIGLSAARAIAQAHGGTVLAGYDNPRKMIVFTVKL